MKQFTLILSCALLIATACGTSTPETANAEGDTLVAAQPLAFVPRKIADSLSFLWAHTPAEVTGDDLVDVVFINNNSTGGFLGYVAGQPGADRWQLDTIAPAPPTGGLFAAGDLECADLDGDGDTDVFAVKHPGEWQDANAPAELFWYENPGWQAHAIGTVPDALKDVNFADFNQDGKMDVVVLTFEEHTLSVFQQSGPDTWKRVQFLSNHNNFHEGMATGDADGDGFPDIAANGYVLYSPGHDLTQPWREENLDEKWNTQTGDWSRNGTKAFMRDLDGDGRSEIFVSHSERAGYPVVYYQNTGDGWQEHVIADSLPACHSLQVYDFDLDGDYDVLAGVNKDRAVNLEQTEFPVVIFLSEDDYTRWNPMIIGEDGIYNGQAFDYDGDGDTDILRYPGHMATELYLWENQVR